MKSFEEQEEVLLLKSALELACDLEDSVKSKKNLNKVYELQDTLYKLLLLQRESYENVCLYILEKSDKDSMVKC